MKRIYEVRPINGKYAVVGKRNGVPLYEGIPTYEQALELMRAANRALLVIELPACESS